MCFVLFFECELWPVYIVHKIQNNKTQLNSSKHKPSVVHLTKGFFSEDAFAFTFCFLVFEGRRNALDIFSAYETRTGDCGCMPLPQLAAKNTGNLYIIVTELKPRLEDQI